MKILVLMPLDEKSTFMSAGIYKYLANDVKDNCFSMPNFMDYLIQTKMAPNWTYSLFDTIIAAESVYQAAEKEGNDLIIIGNMSIAYDFDLIVNFQDLVESLPYEDKFVEKVKEIVKEEKVLLNKLNLYQNKDSSLAMHNVEATAKFLSDYIKTDPHLERIEQEYEEKLQEWMQSQKLTILN